MFYPVLGGAMQSLLVYSFLWPLYPCHRPGFIRSGEFEPASTPALRVTPITKMNRTDSSYPTLLLQKLEKAEKAAVESVWWHANCLQGWKRPHVTSVCLIQSVNTRDYILKSRESRVWEKGKCHSVLGKCHSVLDKCHGVLGKYCSLLGMCHSVLGMCQCVRYVSQCVG